MDFNSIFDQMEKERQKAFDIKKDSKEKSPISDNDSKKATEDQESTQDNEEPKQDNNESLEEDHETEEDEKTENNSESEDKPTEDDEPNDQDRSLDDEKETKEVIDTEEQGEEQTEVAETTEETQETHEESTEEDTDSQNEDTNQSSKESEDSSKEADDNSKEAQEPKKDLADHLDYPNSNALVKSMRNDSVQEEIQQVKQTITKTESREIVKDSAENKEIKDQNNKKDVQSKPEKDVIPMPEKTEKIVKTTVTVKKIKSASTAPKRVKAKVVKAAKKLVLPKKAKIIHKKTVKIVKIKPIIKKITHHKKTVVKQIPKQQLKKLASMQNELKKLKASISQASKREKGFQKKDLADTEKRKLDQEIVKIKKEIDHLKEFQPDTLLESIRRLNENITEMNSLFKLSTELMQKSDPIDSKLKQLSDENEKIAQGILTVLDAVNDLKEGKVQEINELNKIEDEIKLPLRNIASRPEASYNPPSIPAPPPEFMESSFSKMQQGGDDGIPTPPSMTPMPPSAPSDVPPTSIQAPNVMPMPKPQRKPLTGGPLPNGFDMPPQFSSASNMNGSSVSPVNFSADDLDRFAAQTQRPQAPQMQMPLSQSARKRQQRADLKI
jgi:hypothetical protein